MIFVVQTSLSYLLAITTTEFSTPYFSQAKIIQGGKFIIRGRVVAAARE